MCGFVLPTHLQIDCPTSSLRSEPRVVAAGSLPQLGRGPLRAFCNASSVAGVGMLPEGINQNTPWYTFLLDTNWVEVGGDQAPPVSCRAGEPGSSLDVGRWVRAWARERYGGGPVCPTKARLGLQRVLS